MSEIGSPTDCPDEETVADDDVDDENFEDEESENPWDEDPLDDMPEVITPGGPICVTLWSDDFSEDPIAYDIEFRWGGEQEADWSDDISWKNDDLSAGSSAPVYGKATWRDGDDVHLSYSSNDLDLEGETVLEGSAPSQDRMSDPMSWVSLAEDIHDFVLGLLK